jgi:hypothetical protein
MSGLSGSGVGAVYELKSRSTAQYYGKETNAKINAYIFCNLKYFQLPKLQITPDALRAHF